MKAVKVQYRVDPSFSETNKANIAKIMDALKADPIDGITYAAFVQEDGESFIHIVIVRDEAAQAKLTDLPTFKAFQKALRESDPTSPPSPQDLELVGASFAV